MKNTFFTILVCIVFASMVFGTFYFWLKANKIGLKNKNGLDRLFSKLSPEEMIWQKNITEKQFCVLVVEY